MRARLKPSPSAMRTPIRRILQTPTSRQTAEYTSLYVGSLPAQISQEELRELFGSYGTIRNVEIISSQSINRKSHIST